MILWQKGIKSCGKSFGRHARDTRHFKEGRRMSCSIFWDFLALRETIDHTTTSIPTICVPVIAAVQVSAHYSHSIFYPSRSLFALDSERFLQHPYNLDLCKLQWQTVTKTVTST